MNVMKMLIWSYIEYNYPKRPDNFKRIVWHRLYFLGYSETNANAEWRTFKMKPTVGSTLILIFTALFTRLFTLKSFLSLKVFFISLSHPHFHSFSYPQSLTDCLLFYLYDYKEGIHFVHLFLWNVWNNLKKDTENRKTRLKLILICICGFYLLRNSNRKNEEEKKWIMTQTRKMSNQIV